MLTSELVINGVEYLIRFGTIVLLPRIQFSHSPRYFELRGVSNLRYFLEVLLVFIALFNVILQISN